MALVLGGAVAGAASAFASAAGTALATGTALAASTAGTVAISAGIGALLGGVQQIEAELRAEEIRRRLAAAKQDPTLNITAASTTSPYVYGTARVGGILAFINAANNRLIDNTNYRPNRNLRTDSSIEWGDTFTAHSRNLDGSGSQPVYDRLRGSPRPYMNIAMLISKGACSGIDEVYINGELVPTIRHTLRGRSSRGRRLLKSGRVLIPTSEEYYPWLQYERDGRFLNARRMWPLFQVFEYFKADGTEGYSLFNATDSIENDDNQTSQFNRMFEHVNSSTGAISNWMNGYSWVHIYMDSIPQANSEDMETAAIEHIGRSRAFTSIPKFEFLVNGRILTPEFAIGHLEEGTNVDNNPAVVLYDYMTEVQGYPQDAIDQASLRAAVSRCQDTVTITSQDWRDIDGNESLWLQYSGGRRLQDDSATITQPRYTADGVIYAGEPSENIYSELAFAMQGSIVQSGGVFYIRAGEDTDPIGTITENGILDRWTINPGPTLQDRVNAVDMGLTQSFLSRTTDEKRLWLPTTLKRRVNTSALERDGEMFLKDLGNRRFVNDPLIAQRLMAIQLRRFEANKTYSTRIAPGDAFEWFIIKPGDIININDSVLNLVVPAAEILSMQINEDMSINLTVREKPDGTYADTLDLPPVQEPQLVHPVISAPVSIKDVSGLQTEVDSKPSRPYVDQGLGGKTSPADVDKKINTAIKALEGRIRTQVLGVTKQYYFSSGSAQRDIYRAGLEALYLGSMGGYLSSRKIWGGVSTSENGMTGTIPLTNVKSRDGGIEFFSGSISILYYKWNSRGLLRDSTPWRVVYFAW